MRLTEAHEIGHQIIPWHEAAFQLDDEERLLGRTRDQLEREAYLACGHLIFQGAHFWRRALDYQVSIGTPVALAPEYGASLHATIRYYVLHHPDPVAVLVAGRYLSSNGSVPVWGSVDSPSFQAMSALADAGLSHLIAPVRPNLKEQYPTIPIERYARWTPRCTHPHRAPPRRADHLGVQNGDQPVARSAVTDGRRAGNAISGFGELDAPALPVLA